MCAIAGILNIYGKPLSAEDEREMEELLRTMCHRGPDHSGWVRTSPTAILGSNRLSITDARNEAANMPFTSADGECVIVYNGELYNFRALRERLGAAKFRTNSDTEVVLAAYQKWGAACLDEFEGMYAFCIHDRRDNTFFLAIDHSGQKPLYYLKDEDSLVFSSEIEPLVRDARRKKSWDRDGIAEIIALRFTVGEDTHIREIKKLEPGCCLKIRGQEVRKERHYLVPVENQGERDAEAVGARLADATRMACQETFDLEVPYGLLLSGGVDSSVVLAEFARKKLPMRTYSIGFEKMDGPSIGDEPPNEFPFSRQMSKHFGTAHTEVLMTVPMYFRSLERWIATMGEPLGGQEAPCLYELLSRAKHECRVVFCGSGPDEVFDGYKNGRDLIAQGGVNSQNCAERYFDSFLWLFKVELEKLLPDTNVRSRTVQKFQNWLDLYGSKTQDVMQLVQLINFHGRCASYEYRQIDKISMHHSIEVRSPLAARRMTKAAFDFAPELKCRDGHEKWIWKQACRAFLPESIVNRRKEGFPIPIPIWFTKEYEAMVEPLLDAGSPLLSLGMIDRDYLLFCWKNANTDYRNLFFRLLVLNGVMAQQIRYVN